MQIIREIATHRALYLLPDFEPVSISARGLITPSLRALDVHPDTHEAVSGQPPELWLGGALSYNAGVWTVLDAPAYAQAQATKLDSLQATIVMATQQRLDVFFQTRGYDGILSAATYATSSVPKFAAEGQYAVAARDATWAGLYDFMAQVQAGAAPMPTSYADVEPLLPVLTWPA